MNLIKYFVLFSIALPTFLMTTARAETWKTITSPHFKIIVAQKFTAQGLHIAEQAERALTQLQNIYTEIPSQKILLVVDHRTNASNGSATHFPYPHIVIYPALPTTYSSIGEYNEWVYELVLHELVHFLTFFPNHGIYKPVQWIFGNLFAPNFVLLPSWFHEGLAVSLETHLTTGGRMRSEGYKEMFKILGDDLKHGHESLATINERYIPSFPYGQRPYFFGAMVVNETTKTKGPKDLDKMIQGFSRALPPYNIYSSVKKNFGQSFRTSRKQLTLAPEILSLEERYKDVFKFTGHSPVWLDDFTFLAIRPTKDLMPQLVKYDLRDKKPQRGRTLRTILGTERISLSSDKKLLLYDQLAPFARMQNTTDLYVLNLVTQKSKRITYGGRLREGAFSKNARKIIAVQTDLATTKLVEIDLKDPSKINVLYSPKKVETRITGPSYVAKDQKILFIEKLRAQPSQLKILDRKSKSISTVDLSKSFEKLFWAEFQDGQLVLHAKEKNKPRQHYLLDSKFNPRQITFDAIGTRSAAVRNNQVLVTHISDKDYVTAFYKNYKAAPKTDLKDYNIELSPNLIFQDAATKPVETKTKGYSFLNYMIPRYWFPFISPNYGGFADQFLYSMSTGSSDPLGVNSYSATLRQDTISKRLSGGVNFFHVNKNLIWGLSANQFESPLQVDISRTIQYLGVSSRYDFGQDRNLGGALTLSLNHYDASLEALQQIKSFGPQLTYNYNSLMQEPSRVAPSRGQYASLSVAHYLEQDNYFSYNFLDAYYETYFSKHIIPKGTSLKFFGKGLASTEPLPAVFRPVNLSGYFTTSRQQNSFVIRGYPSGIFQASEAAYSMGFEYYFPLLNIFSGPEALPVFFRRVFGALVADMGSFNGSLFNGVDAFVAHDFTDTYYGVGMEVHAELTIGHYVPIKLSLGLYQGLNELAGVQPNQIFFNFSTPALP